MAKNNHKTVKSEAEKKSEWNTAQRKGKSSLNKFSFNKTEIEESDKLRKKYLNVNLNIDNKIEHKQFCEDDEF